jgi:hypothetical protein
LVYFQTAPQCPRCGADQSAIARVRSPKSLWQKLLRRAGICLIVCVVAVFGFYLSLIGSASSLTIDEKHTVRQAIAVLREKGFSDEAMLLDYVTAFRRDDNWLNASVPKENAYAATNFPFEIMTLYPDFFTYPVDDVERAAILLHESKHLAGKDEHDAYEFVWKNRTQLGWTEDKYKYSAIWQNVRKQTRDNVPELFVCEKNEFQDCTETANQFRTYSSVR